MDPTPAPSPGFLRRLLKWPGRLLHSAFVVIVGVVLGQQYVNPQKRVIPVLVAMLATGLVWRVGMVAGLGVLIMALPYPGGTVFGNTNLALILILLVIWLLRITQGLSPAPRRTPVDIPIVGLLIMYMLSFYNVRTQPYLAHGLENFELFAAAVLMFYMIVSNVRTSRDLERLNGFMMLSAASIFALAVYELNHPAAVFIRGWIDFTRTTGTEFNTRNVRVGSVFYDFELLSEFCALTIMMAAFHFARANSLARVLIYGSFMMLNVFVLFATVTRGAIISLGAGLLYLMWIMRRRLRVVPLTIIVVTVITSFLAMNFFVANFTRSGDLVARLTETHLVNNWMPEDRVDAWTNGWNRALVHPLIGGGPSYADLPGLKRLWPHNLYLYYASLVGFPGLLFFLWMLYKFLRLTRPTVDDLRHPDYPRAYLMICRVQFLIFALNEFKIEYVRSNIYIFPVWVLFAVWTVTARLSQAASTAGVAPLELPIPTSGRLRAMGQ